MSIVNTTEQKLTHEFTVAEVNVILAALSELPFKVAASIIAKIQTQAQTQLQVPAIETATATAETPVS